MSILDAVAGSVITLAVKEGVPLAWKAYKNRRIEPKKAHQQYLLDQAAWFQNRCIKLRALLMELAHRSEFDKFQLAVFVSKLDHEDQKWAMKISDRDQLLRSASDKAAECEENASECGRQAEYVDTHTFW